MAETWAGFDGGPWFLESQWSDVWGAALTNGVIPASTQALQVYSDADGRQVKVRSGKAVIRGHQYNSDSTKVIPLQPNGSSNARIDMIVLRLDTAGKRVYSDVVTGTAASTPLRPGLTRVAGGIWEEPLAAIPVPAGFGSIASNTVSDERAFALPIEPLGVPKPFGGATAPLGYVLCQGQSLRRDAYPALFAVLGTTWGSNDPLTFKVPDLRDKFPMGANGNVGTYSGDDTFTIDVAHMPSHKHAVDGDYGNRYLATVSSSTVGLTSGNGAQAVSFTDTDPEGGGQAINWRPPHAKLNYILRAL